MDRGEPVSKKTDQKMNPKVKAAWVAALRSGEYKQGKYYLHVTQDSTGDEYCCLGVLCELAIKAGVALKSKPAKEWLATDTPGKVIHSYVSIDDHAVKFLPWIVEEWAGIDATIQLRIDGEFMTAVVANDSGKTFEQIAQAIEEQL